MIAKKNPEQWHNELMQISLPNKVNVKIHVVGVSVSGNPVSQGNMYNYLKQDIQILGDQISYSISRSLFDTNSRFS